MAYLWGWPLVYVYNQRTELTKAPEPLLLNGALPIAPSAEVGRVSGKVTSLRPLFTLLAARLDHD